MYRTNQQVSILGSTGSIGRQTLRVCRSLGIRVAALTAHTNIAMLEAQARAYLPDLVVVGNEALLPQLRVALADTPVKVAGGEAALEMAAALPQAGTVVAAIVGIAGLRPVLAAAGAGKMIALANKESLVSGGELVTGEVKRNNASLVPVDSEHSAIFQCLNGEERRDVSGVLLTASGGPFFGKSAAELEKVTPQQALCHPNWDMGDKITIDSATMMNKGLEMIEAMWLFGLSREQIEIVIHRQSIVHSGVFFDDGSLITQMGYPDMRIAIQYALTYPRRRMVEGVSQLSLTELGSLTFEQPDRSAFLCLPACELAAAKGGFYPAVANGANEAAVQQFMEGNISFLQIGELVMGAVEQLRMPEDITLELIWEADALGRGFVERELSKSSKQIMA